MGGSIGLGYCRSDCFDLGFFLPEAVGPSRIPRMESFCQPNPGKSYSLAELARLLGASLEGDPDIRIYGVSSLEAAHEGQLSFITDKRYKSSPVQSKASAFIIGAGFERPDAPVLISSAPYLAMARAAGLFAEPPFLEPGIHPTAHVGADARIDPSVSVGPLASIGAASVVGGGTRIYGSVYLGRQVHVGAECLIYPGVIILDRCRVGDRVVIHSGTVVGSDGFGFAQDEEGCHVKIPQTGIVEIEDNVEIGANCSIDRATFGRTLIGRGTKIDNLVQVAHNVTIGEHAILVSQVGVSGSTRIGRHAVLAGQVGVAGHIEIGDMARVAAKSGVAHSVGSGQDVAGIPAVPVKEWRKAFVNIQRLAKLKEDVRNLEEKVEQLQKALIHGE